MSNFVSLEDAAKKLGKSAEELVEMRSRGEIFGYRDGASWKFKPEEIERVASELMGDALDEDPAGSSILVSDSDLGMASGHGSTIGSDLSLVPDPESGSDVRLVANDSSADDSALGSGLDDDLVLASSDDDDDELSLAADDGDDLLAAASDAASKVGSDLDLGLGSEKGSGAGSDIPLGSDLDLGLAPDSDLSNINVLGDSDLNIAPSSDLITGDSDPGIDSGSFDLGGSDLELDDGDLVLGGGSDLALGADSGINLMSPADSGISLEDEPLDLAASGISGLDLAMEGSDVGSASGSSVDFQQDEEFQLSPSGALDMDDDSGSQVIELDDSSDFGDAAVALPSDDGGFDAFSDVESGGSLDSEDAFGDMAPAAAGAAAVMGAPEVPYSTLQVLGLLGILLLMSLSGIMLTDIVRNMWAWSNNDVPLTSGFTEMVLGAFGQK